LITPLTAVPLGKYEKNGKRNQQSCQLCLTTVSDSELYTKNYGYNGFYDSLFIADAQLAIHY